ncbi:Integrator complex subunit 11 [Nowakowskiella sp. JEL0078]|nr:Integrator complex subunit 11 [Nowakowskiella sp. JEL0078]
MSGKIKVVPLGAGQDVGRSCILLSINGKNIMFDCGMHMGYNDERRFPDFSYISKSGQYTDLIDCVIISHFHLDHCGALPYFTEICGYDGPVYMTAPTKGICPILLEDMRKIVSERQGEPNFFTSADIVNCMKKCIPVQLHESVQVDEEIIIRPYYAGHVLGAAMFHVQVGNASVVYTGDYNMTPDRHLGAAWIDKCRPDLLITETTYATTIRDSKRTREREFLRKVHECVAGGGKVLIPVFALGRAQELCILVESYWERMELDVPVYFSAGLTERANEYYKLFITWTNEKIKRSFDEHNMFDFKHIRAWDSSLADEQGPAVLFATPGMLHAGTSLEIFKKWCHDSRNMIVMPGYCVPGTVGAKVLAGEKKVAVDKYTSLEVNLTVENLSFSAHADAKGIMQLIRMCEPKNVLLVHGEKAKMAVLKERIQTEIGIPCFDPANGCTVILKTDLSIPCLISQNLLLSNFKRVVDVTGINAESMRYLNSTTLRVDPKTIKPICHIPLLNSVVVYPDLKPLPILKESSEDVSNQVEALSHVVRVIHQSEAVGELGMFNLDEVNIVNSSFDIGCFTKHSGDTSVVVLEILKNALELNLLGRESPVIQMGENKSLEILMGDKRKKGENILSNNSVCEYEEVCWTKSDKALWGEKILRIKGTTIRIRAGLSNNTNVQVGWRNLNDRLAKSVLIIVNSVLHQ